MICSTKLQSWDRRKRVRLEEEINQCVCILDELRGQPNGLMHTQYVTTREKHARLLVQEDAFWKQRAKVKRLVSSAWMMGGLLRRKRICLLWHKPILRNYLLRMRVFMNRC